MQKKTPNNDDEQKKERPAVNLPHTQALESYRKAVALQYDGLTAPEVTATGMGNVAAEIIEIARASGVPLYENTELVEMLAMLDLGDKIPQELYVVMAQIIALAYNIKPPITPTPDEIM